MHNELVFYPQLGAFRDLVCFRLSGSGLGNSFYNYFHAYVLTRKHGGQLIRPPWPSLKVGPILRSETRKRFYVGLFHVLDDEISGAKKLITLANSWPNANRVTVDHTGTSPVAPAGLNLISSKSFTFHGLSDYRSEIRARLLKMIREPTPIDFCWGASGHIACHVRLGGDFAPAIDIAELNRGVSNRRIPISWYAGILKRLKNEYPDKRIFVVSDGRPVELRDLLALGAELPPTTSDIGDLLTLSSASILVGSNSTFSRWAAFLGNMPSIWIAKTEDARDMCDGPPISFIPIGTENDATQIWC